MILLERDSDVLLITQPDHSALAARLIAGWTADGFPTLGTRPLVMLAVAEHDNGWREPDSAPIVGTDGRILDFVNAPAEVRQSVWPRGVDRLASNPYAAALVAQHAIHVNDRHRSSSSWQRFFVEMTARRNRFREQAGRTEQELLADYFFVRVADLMSLVYCNAWRNEQVHGSYRIAASERNRLTVSPDPFGGREISFAIDARRLPKRSFDSAAGARQAFDAAKLVTLEGVAAGA